MDYIEISGKTVVVVGAVNLLICGVSPCFMRVCGI
jgi:hypothetical protein